MLTRQDGSTETANIGSPYLAVLFEQHFHRGPEGAADAAWLAFVDRHDRPPQGEEELLAWLKPFVATDTAEFTPDPTTASNGAQAVSSPG